ncbi:hypothetical protein RhiirA5_437991, partial [Rhizophagus irregularis]
LSKILAFAHRKNGNLAEALSILKEMEEAGKWFDILLTKLAEPILGKFKDDEFKWKKDAFHLTEKIFPVVNSTAKLIGLINN